MDDSLFDWPTTLEVARDRHDARLNQGRGPRHRTPDRTTSVEGAATVAMRAGTQKHRLLVAYRDAAPYGFNAWEVAKHVGLERSCYWKRVSELQQQGLLALLYQPDGRPMTRPGEFDAQREVYGITPAGRTLLATLEAS